jgi:hypothetical protein
VTMAGLARPTLRCLREDLTLTVPDSGMAPECQLNAFSAGAGCPAQVQNAPGSMGAAARAIAGHDTRSRTLAGSASRSRVVIGESAGLGSGRG